MDMVIGARHIAVVSLVVTLSAWAAPFAAAQHLHNFIFPEQRTIQDRDPSELPSARIPDMPPPATVDDLQEDLESFEISLDEAIRIALANSEVVRDRKSVV